MTSVEIQIEPIIKRRPIIKLLSGTNRAIPSLKMTEIAFKIYNRSNVSLNEIKLEEIAITGMGCSFTYGNSPDFRVVDLAPGESKITKYLPVLFPVAGVYWLDLRIILDSVQRTNYIVIPRQTHLKDSSRCSSGRAENKPLDLVGTYCLLLICTVSD